MQVIIIGGGPRGLAVLERLTAHCRVTGQTMAVRLFDPYGPGGKVWRSSQSLQLLINSVVDQVTLFTDESLSSGGPIVKGPSLYEWSQTVAADFIREQQLPEQEAFLKETERLGPNDHCARAFYGLYQKWFYQQLLTQLPEQVTVQFVKEQVAALHKTATGFKIQTATEAYYADRVVMALGHHETELSKKEKELAAYAKAQQLLYSPPQNAADADFSQIQPRETVLLKGLGLSFFDYVTMLTLERGGSYQRRSGKLVYQSSGREPLIVAGSSRGFPYHPRGKNQAGYGQQYQPRFLTDQQLASWHRQGRVKAKMFYGLLQKEMELTYYRQLLPQKYPQVDVSVFEADFIRGRGAETVLQAHGITQTDWWDWQFIEQPDTRRQPHESFADFIQGYLAWDIAEACKGNQRGPVSSAFEVLKDLRDQVRFMLDHALFTEEELVREHWGWFVPLNSFLSIGPPLCRSEELLALMEAGIVQLLAPEMRVALTDGQFVAFSKREPTVVYRGRVLLEARLQPTAVNRSKNPLLKQLLQANVIQPYRLLADTAEEYQTGAVMVERLTNEVLTETGQKIAGLFCYGIPTEGLHWLTAATARPGTDPWNLREADRIAQQICLH